VTAASPMPFGKHRGRALSQLPEEYVSWLLTQDYLRPELRATLESLPVNSFSEHAADRPAARSSVATPEALKPYIKAIVLGGYKVGLEKLEGVEKIQALKKARELLESTFEL
jgi:hypothetical protein